MNFCVCKDALLQANNGKRFENIYKSTCAIFFLNTPHEGMNVNEIIQRIKDTAPGGVSSRLSFIEQLSENSNFLSTQRQYISYLLNPNSGIEILSFYETVPIRTVLQTLPGGCNSEEIVGNSNEILFAIPPNNSGLQFHTVEDTTYQTIVTYLLRHIQKIKGNEE